MAKRKRFPTLALVIIAFVLLGIFAVLAYFSMEIFAPKIGVITIDSTITTHKSEGLFGKTLSSKDVVDLIKQAEDDPSIKVIFLDINSPGGSVVASKAIAYAVRNCSKPVVAYIEDIGTSGAYYVASASDLVIADEDSLTGSIGVIMELENYAGLLEKLGINVTTLKKGEYKDIANPTRPGGITPGEREILNQILDLAYQHFKRDLLTFRGDRLKAPIDEIADGRVMTGYQAWKLGLVDELGTRQYALKKAWELAGESGEPQVMELKKEEFSLMDILAEAGYSFTRGALAALDSQDLKISASF